MMAFFKRNIGGGQKRKLQGKRKSDATSFKRLKKSKDDEEILSSENEEDELNLDKRGTDNNNAEEIFENAEAKSVRESKRVLEQLQIDDNAEKREEELLDEDAIEHRLKKEEVEHRHRKLADSVVIDEDSVVSYRPHKLSPVCVAISNDGRFVVSCSKDGSIVKYDLEQGKKAGILMPCKSKNSHIGQVRCVSISGDDKYLASGGDDRAVRVWLLENLSHVKSFQGHQGPVTSLVFRKNSNDLYSGSADKCIRSWDLNQMGFVEIMYGHVDTINQIDMLDKPKLLSAGSTARTMHLFKIEQSSQLVFNGLSDCISIDTIAMINDDHYVSGQMDGSLYIWSVFKKKPVCVLKNAHKTSEDNFDERWLVSVAALPYTDLIASGSSDGTLKLWKVGENYKSLALIDKFELAGFLNDLRFSADGKRLVVAVGQEHRSGRWWRNREARNSVVILNLQFEDDEKAETQIVDADSD